MKKFRIHHYIIRGDSHLPVTTIECTTEQQIYFAQEVISQAIADLRRFNFLPRDHYDNYLVVEMFDGEEWVCFLSDEDDEWEEYCLKHFDQKSRGSSPAL